jgi:hypothetical protein
MIPNAFIGWTQAPSAGELSAALGPAKALWERLLEDLGTELDLVDQEWKCSGRKYGWSLRLKQGKRNILYLSPCQGCFRVAFILGDRALAVARSSGFSDRFLQLIDEAPRYPEGTGIRLDLAGPEDLPGIKTLAHIKLKN